MSDIGNFQECLDCPGCSGDCGQGCGSCPENKQSSETEGTVVESLVEKVEINVETTQTTPEAAEKEAPRECKEVEIDPMDEDEIAEKTEDLRPKIDPSRGKLDCFNYLADIPGGKADYDIVEVQFKNTRKGFYRNTANLDLKLGDMVAVESQPGHDIGRVTLVGHLVRNQMKKAGLSEDSEIRKIFRFARESDMEKYYEAKALEIPTMIGSRQIAAELGLKMKIGDVEYQGDGLKAIFYYIADERVDFRQLIKILAERFKIRVEMRQIGARQEAGRIGGIGPCGRPLCCSTWMTNFVTVATSAARHQDLSLNPQKLAGQCAKLKCCLNFEIDTYLESVKKMPPKETRLETLEASWYHFKTDIFKGEITYSSDKKNAVNTVTITAERAFEIIEMNSRGEKPLSLIPDEEAKTKAQGSYNDILGDDSEIGRFDKKKKKKKKKKDKEAAAGAATASATTESSESAEGQGEDSTQGKAPIPAKAKEQSKNKQKNKDNSKDASKDTSKDISDAPRDEALAVESGVVSSESPSEPISEGHPQPEPSVDKGAQKTEDNSKESLTQDNAQAVDKEVITETEEVQPESTEPQSVARDVPSVEPSEQALVESELQSEPETRQENAEAQSSEPTENIEANGSEPSGNVTDEISEKEVEAKVQIVEKAQEVASLNEEVVSEESAPSEDKALQGENGENIENSPEHRHYHQNHHHHNHDNNAQGVNVENGAESSEGRDFGRKGNNPNHPNNSNNPNNPNKPQWQGKNQGKNFKPQQGKGGQEQQKNREGVQGKVFKPQQGKGAQEQPQHGASQHPQTQHPQAQHQHGQQQRGQQPGQGAQVKEPFKPKGQNPQQDRRNNQGAQGNPGKVFKPQRQGDGTQRLEPQGLQGQGQNPHSEEFHPQGNPNKKKKNKKPFNPSENAANQNQQPQQGDQGRPHHQGHHNPNRQGHGPRPNQNQGPRNQNPGNGNGE